MAVSKSTVRECVYCGQSFEFLRRKGAQPKLCSEACRKAWAKAESARRSREALAERGPLRYELTCIECGGCFVGMRTDARLCGERCRTDRSTRLRRESGRLRGRTKSEAEKQWMAANRNRYRDERSCARCAETFYAKPETVSRLCVPCRVTDRKSVVKWAPPTVPPVVTGGKWTAGTCRVCTEGFISPYADVTCSPVCKRIHRNRRSAGSGWISAEDRARVYLRDGFVCQLCLKPVDRFADSLSNQYPSLDHIIPRSKGGSDDLENLQTAHRLCNSVRSDRSIWEVSHPSQRAAFLAAVS